MKGDKFISYVEGCELTKQMAEKMFWHSVDQVSKAERSNSIACATVWSRREARWQNILREIRELQSREFGPHGIEPSPSPPEAS